MSDTFIATEQPDGTWNLDRQLEGGNLWGCATGLDAMQANTAAALLNGNEDLEFDNEGQAVIYTGYMQDPDRPDEDGIMRYVPFDPETADHA